MIGGVNELCINQPHCSYKKKKKLKRKKEVSKKPPYKLRNYVIQISQSHTKKNFFGNHFFEQKTKWPYSGSLEGFGSRNPECTTSFVMRDLYLISICYCMLLFS